MSWQEEIFDVMKAEDVKQIAYLPDAGHSCVIAKAISDPVIQDVVLTTEEEGIGVVSGAWLGGQRAALLMQSSGVGNCVNMFSLLGNCSFPFLTLVTMRGEFAEFNPWQEPMGQATPVAFESMGIKVMRVEQPEEAGEIVSAAAYSVYQAGDKVAVLLSQRLIGRKEWSR